jgi:hypothetical protein
VRLIVTFCACKQVCTFLLKLHHKHDPSDEERIRAGTYLKILAYILDKWTVKEAEGFEHKVESLKLRLSQHI